MSNAEKYPNLHRLHTEGTVLTYEQMQKIITSYWGDCWPSDDWYALEEAIKETMK